MKSNSVYYVADAFGVTSFDSDIVRQFDSLRELKLSLESDYDDDFVLVPVTRERIEQLISGCVNPDRRGEVAE
jgi:hypothetical protein